MKHNRTKYTSQGYWTSSLQNINKYGTSTNNGDIHIITKVVGVSFENRQEVVAKLSPGEEVILRRKPENPFDANAIRVERRNCEQIGYIDRHKAACGPSISRSKKFARA